jgi:kinesin family protein 3/17
LLLKEEKIQLEEKYKDLNDEAQSKTRKLKKLRTMILKSESELKDIQEEHQRMKESMLDSIRELTKDLKLQMQIINSYIPIEFQVNRIFAIINIYNGTLTVFCLIEGSH